MFLLYYTIDCVLHILITWRYFCRSRFVRFEFMSMIYTNFSFCWLHFYTYAGSWNNILLLCLVPKIQITLFPLFYTRFVLKFVKHTSNFLSKSFNLRKSPSCLVWAIVRFQLLYRLYVSSKFFLLVSLAHSIALFLKYALNETQFKKEKW